MAKEWTDVDYAQAAIDMLPGTVEEIEEFLRVHGIKNQPTHPRSHTCPIAQWINKWAGVAYISTGWDEVYLGADASTDVYVSLPEYVGDFIQYADKTVRH